jgi:uncharacterized membrane protein YbaN (DUF454 family)
MSTKTIQPVADPAELSRPLRWALVAAGVACVALGAVGAVLPGLPTTIFLILATGCFTRSCPWLERKLIRENRIFRPFLGYLRPGARMPRRARIVATVAMWSAVALSVVSILAATESLVVLPTVVVISAGAGTVFIWTTGRPPARA